jgi:hypothetical protein
MTAIPNQTPASAATQPRWRSIASRSAIVLICVVALLQCLGGFYRQNEAAVSRESIWFAAYWPPPWLLLCLVVLLSAFSLWLIVRLQHSESARLLALFGALLASGYGVIATASYSLLFDGYFKLVQALPLDSPSRVPLLRFAHVIDAIERILWIPAWALAATVALFFVRALLNVRATATRHRRWEVTFVASVALLMLTSLGRTYLVAAGACIVGLVLVVAAAKLYRSRPKLLLAYPAALALVSALSPQAVDTTIIFAYGWAALCMILLVVTTVRALPTLADHGRTQALWFLSGWTLATVAAFTWYALAVTAALLRCGPISDSALCLMTRYREWFFIAPLPILLASFVMALLYPGLIDAARFCRRSVVYGSLFLLSLFTFGAIEALLGDWLRRGLPWGTPPVVAAGVFAVLFYPARQFCDRITQMLFARLLAWAER